MDRASLIPRGLFDMQSPFDLLLVPDIYGDQSAQGLQCETSPCDLFLQNSGVDNQGIQFKPGDRFRMNVQWNNVTFNQVRARAGFPPGYPWTPAYEDPFIVRLLGLHYDPDLNLPPVFDTPFQGCDTIDAITDRGTCEPLDANDNPILFNLGRVWIADETHCPANAQDEDGYCRLTVRIEFKVNAPNIATAELLVHSAVFESIH